MATWKSNKSITWDEDHGLDYSKNENSWEYGTVSDVLTVKTKVGEFSDFNHHPATEKIEFYQKSEALALLETLIDWAETFEGQGTVAKLMERRIKE